MEKVIETGAKASGLVLADTRSLAETMIDSLGSLGCKKALRLMEVVAATSNQPTDDLASAQQAVLETILEDMLRDASEATEKCKVII